MLLDYNEETGEILEIDHLGATIGKPRRDLAERIILGKELQKLRPKGCIIQEIRLASLQKYNNTQTIYMYTPEIKPTGWKWLQSLPDGSHRTNSGGAKFIKKADGLYWQDHNEGMGIWYWSGNRDVNFGKKQDWRTKTWVVNASEETCPEWEEPKELTGWEYLRSLDNNTQFISPMNYKTLFTKMEDGLYFNWWGKTHKAAWDGGDTLESNHDWRTEHLWVNISAKNIKFKEH